MSEKKFLYILKRAFDEKVKTTIRTESHNSFPGYILDIGDDYVMVKWSLKKKCDENYIKLSSIESISTQWEE
ncbi:MAG: hypothetical protein EAX95_06380 [Candidatus Thorarchaeota archaeon]|nr:hypothetical protein [Candidatus Thorarchaeota archaeon]